MLSKRCKIYNFLEIKREIRRAFLIEVPEKIIFENEGWLDTSFFQRIKKFKKTRSGYYFIKISEIPQSVLFFLEENGLRQLMGYSINILEHSQNIELVQGEYCVDYQEERILTTEKKVAKDLLANMRIIQ